MSDPNPNIASNPGAPPAPTAVTAAVPPKPAAAPKAPAKAPAKPGRRFFLASLVGTTIEFFDFYIYATAAVLVFPKLFFPASNPTSATLESLATFALAFFARPLGAALFGHFGDRKGRKATLVAALMTMGPSTVAIGLLPTYHSIGILAPILLALLRGFPLLFFFLPGVVDALGLCHCVVVFLLQLAALSLEWRHARFGLDEVRFRLVQVHLQFC